jgi:hypothetical protein
MFGLANSKTFLMSTKPPKEKKGKALRIYVTRKNIQDWEGGVRDTVSRRYQAYCNAYGYPGKVDLTILEYAALKGIDPAEVFLRLDMKIAVFTTEQVELCMVRLRRRLAEVKKRQIAQDTAQKIQKTAVKGKKKVKSK